MAPHPAFDDAPTQRFAAPVPDVPAPAPAKRRRRWPWAVGGLAVLLVIAAGNGGDTTAPAVASSGSTATAPAAVAPPEQSAAPSFTYSVTGPKKAMITYTGKGMSMSQETSAKVPWTKTVPADSSFAIASLTAQNAGSGTISCKITDQDGNVISEQSSSGAYAVVACSGSSN